MKASPPPQKPAKPAEKPVDKAAAKPAPKPETKPDAKPASGKTYFLQLGAFSSENNAHQLQSRAQAAGIKAILVSANGQYRVRVGPLGDLDKAMAKQGELKSKGLPAVLVTQ